MKRFWFKNYYNKEDVFRLIISIGLALWAGILLYGDKI